MNKNKNENSDGKTPSAKWHQDEQSVFLAFCLEDCKNEKIIINATHLEFEGNAGPKNIFYETKIVLFNNISPDKSRYMIRDREVNFVLKKEISGPYWKRLVKSEAKQHWLSINFDKWKHEEDSEDENDEEKRSQDIKNDPRNGPPPLDFKKHISENVSKGSSLCPLGSAIMGKAMKLEKGLNDLSEKTEGRAFDVNGFDEEAADSDDELLSDLEEDTNSF